MTGVQTCALPICFPVTIQVAQNDYGYCNHEQSVISNRTTSFPVTREQALGWPYRRYWFNEVTEKGRNNYTKDHDIEYEYYNRPTGNEHAGEDIWSTLVPPNVFLKVEPMLGPTGPINITAQVMIEYTVDLEMHEGKFGLMSDLIIQKPGSSGIGYTRNQFGLRAANTIIDPAGQTLGSLSFWSGDGSGTVNNTAVTGASKRPRDEPQTGVYSTCQIGQKNGGPTQAKIRVAESRSDQSD